MGWVRKVVAVTWTSLLVGLVGGAIYAGFFVDHPKESNPTALTELKQWAGAKNGTELGVYSGIALGTKKDTTLNGELELVPVRIQGWMYGEDGFSVAIAAAGKVKAGDKVECLYDHYSDRQPGMGFDWQYIIVCKKTQ